MSSTPNPSPAPALIEFSLPSLEGKEIRLDAQQIKQAGPPRTLKGMEAEGAFYHFTATTSARARITTAYRSQVPAPKLVKKASVTVGTEINGKKIAAFAKDFTSVKRGGATEASGKHPRQFTDLCDGALAVVVAASFGATLPCDPRKLLQSGSGS